MIKRHALSIVAAVLAIACCAPAAALNSRLVGPDGKKQADLRGYDTIQVAEFIDATQPKFDRPEDERAYRAIVAEGTTRFAELLVEQLARTNAFKSVSRAAPQGKAAVVGGKITIYKESNVAARYIGLGIGGAEFDATVEVKDAESGTPLGTMTIAVGSSPVPGATNVVQTVGFLMDSGAQGFTEETLIAKHAKHREETGRSGRSRERYKSK